MCRVNKHSLLMRERERIEKDRDRQTDRDREREADRQTEERGGEEGRKGHGDMEGNMSNNFNCYLS